MFRKDLQRRLEKIFGLEKSTFLAPSDQFEQDTLFIEIETANTRLAGNDGGRETCVVAGSLVVFSQDNKMPFGFYAKAIERADAETKRPLFFHDVDVDLVTSPARMQNIHERRASFVFKYDSQYDPNRGQLTELEFEE